MKMTPRGWVLLVAAIAAAALLVWRPWTNPPPSVNPQPEVASNGPITSETCRGCHPAQFDSWHRTYHRTMTREATPENVKGDFGNAVHEYRGFTSRMTREGDAFFMTTLDPDWSERFAAAGAKLDRVPPPRYAKLRVDRLVGSHWLQECLHRDPSGRYIRLPLLYHIGEKRWVQSNGGFLAPDRDDFWAQSRAANWNESCLYCHNTEPVKNRGPLGYRSEVTELGIACAACHGHGAEHVNDPSAKPTDVANPSTLSVSLRDDICARCHGALVPKPAMWDAVTHRDPFIPGRSLGIFNHVFHSEAEQAELVGLRPRSEKPPPPEPTDGRFWGDGTPLTTALEFNGLALSACYQKGNGSLSCLSCHTMHGDDPNMLLKPKMRTNEACLQCHPNYRDRIAEHTRHGADSAGSTCVNCHMAPQVYSLMTTHRSHRIETPTLAGSLGTGKPHACNLCHLDKPLGWTRDELAKWPKGKSHSAGALTADEESVSSAVLALNRGDARTRAVFAGAFSNPAARQASGTDWFGSFIGRTLEHERYPTVRYLLHRGLPERFEYDPLTLPEERAKRTRAMRDRFDAIPIGRTIPGLPDEPRLEKLRTGRHDPDITVNE